MLFRSFAFAVVSLGASSAFATQFASEVSAYDKGTYAGGYNVGTSATGAPDPITGMSSGFPNVLSPFSPAYDSNQLAGIGKGGAITLSFASPVSVIAGAEIGVLTNFGLWDDAYPTGQNKNPAETFGEIRQADVAVSANGIDFYPVGRVTFDSPANYFANAADPYLSAAPASPVLADFGKPFAGYLSTFNGLNWSQTLAALDGSGGGTWIDVSTSGLSSFQYIQFSIPTNGIANTDNLLFIDAVSVNNTAIPEPASIAVVMLGGWFLRRNRQ